MDTKKKEKMMKAVMKILALFLAIVVSQLVLADMNKYFVFIFATIFLEKLILVEGIKISFIYIIPAACILYMIYVISYKDKLKEWAVKRNPESSLYMNRRQKFPHS